MWVLVNIELVEVFSCKGYYLGVGLQCPLLVAVRPSQDVDRVTGVGQGDKDLIFIIFGLKLGSDVDNELVEVSRVVV